MEINFFTETGKWVGREYFRWNFLPIEAVKRCLVYAKVNETYVTAVKTDGTSCGFWGPEDGP